MEPVAFTLMNQLKNHHLFSDERLVMLKKFSIVFTKFMYNIGLVFEK